MTVEELVHWKPVPIGPDPVGPWVRIIDILEKEKQIEIATLAMEFNKTVIDAQKTILDAQSRTLGKMIEVFGAKKQAATKG